MGLYLESCLVKVFDKSMIVSNLFVYEIDRRYLV